MLMFICVPFPIKWFEILFIVTICNLDCIILDLTGNSLGLDDTMLINQDISDSIPVIVEFSSEGFHLDHSTDMLCCCFYGWSLHIISMLSSCYANKCASIAVSICDVIKHNELITYYRFLKFNLI